MIRGEAATAAEHMTSETTPISERERDILRLVAMGATNQQIANELHISINTVKVHLRNIFEKIGAVSRTEATVYAIRQGLVQLDAAPAVGASPLPAAGSAPATVPLPADPPPADPPPDLSDPAVFTAPIGQAREEPLVAVLSAEPHGMESIALPSATGQHRSWLLPAALGLVALLALAVVYLLVRPPAAPAGSPTATGAAVLNRWKLHPAWPQPRADFAVAAYDGKLYLIGGANGGAPSATVERYDPSKDQLVALNDKPTPATHVQAVTIGGKIYVPGGEAASGQVLDVFEAYDPRTKQWEALPSLPAARSRYALADFEGQLYVFGGWDGARHRAEVFAYDPRTRQWAARAPMRTPRRGAGAALVEERIYVIGGENESGALAVNERYDPTGEDGGVWESVVPLRTPVAAPLVVGTVNSVLLFDAAQRSASEYSPAADAWSLAVDVPADVGLSSRAAALSTSIFLFGADAAGKPDAISEYRVTYSTLVPIVNTGE